MVLKTFSPIGLLNLGWLATLLLLSAMALCADDTGNELAPGLSFVLPESMAVRTFFKHSDDDFPILIGDLEGEPAYFLGAVEVQRLKRRNALWAKLEKELRYIDSSENLSVIARGGFTTEGNHEVMYRGYQLRRNGSFRRQVYFLLQGDTRIYWLTLTTVEDADLEVVIPLAQALIRRIHLAETSR